MTWDISNYFADPNLNVSVNGINIAEGCPAAGYNNALRQIMADIKAFSVFGGPATTAAPGIAQLATPAIVAAGVDATQIVTPATFAQTLQSNSLLFGIAAGTANAQTLSLVPPPLALVTGMQVTAKIATTNTGSATLNLNGLGAKTITAGGGNVGPGALLAGSCRTFIYDGTNWQMIGGGVVASSIGANGYEIHANGKIEQWGQTRGALTEGVWNTAFPVPFPTSVFSVVTVAYNSSGSTLSSPFDYWAQTGSRTLSSFNTVIQTTVVGGVTCDGFDWQAVGN